MADVDNPTRIETGAPFVEILRAQQTGATSTYTSRFANVIAAQVSVEGTNTMTWTRSGRTITVTGTNNDWVNIVIYGQK